jgi:flagellar hook-associated protein 1 FlgK
MDQRDALITKLSQYIGISTVRQDDGSVNVFTGGGQTLVMGDGARPMSLVGSTYDQSRQEIALGQPPINITAQISGGKIGGLLDARTQLIDPIKSQLGRAAAALATAFNAQHVQGVDQNGNAGGLFFNAVSGSASAAATNGGSATVAVGFSNVSQLTGENYKLSYDGANWSLTAIGSGASVALSGSGTAADPFVGAGISLVISGGANAGDSYLIQPTANVAGQMGVAITQPSKIAAASVAYGGVNSADNSNARLLGAIGNLGLLDSGRSSITAANEALISQTGSLAQQAGSRRDAAAAIQAQTQKDMDAVSGVNLDEEAADLVRYQQAYQAAAQIISTAQTVFQSLLNAARG